jgi:hypothetical protein
MATDTDEFLGTEPRPDLAWDDKTPGLCVRGYRDGSKSFIFLYRISNRQHFSRIGKTPAWSLEAARVRANKMRSIVDQGGDPSSLNGEPQPDEIAASSVSPMVESKETESLSGQSADISPGPVVDLLRYIAEESVVQTD